MGRPFMTSSISSSVRFFVPVASAFFKGVAVLSTITRAAAFKSRVQVTIGKHVLNDTQPAE